MATKRPTVSDDAGNVNVLQPADTLAGMAYPVSDQTGLSYTFVLADANTMVRFAPSSICTVSFPTNASVAFPIGTDIWVYHNGSLLNRKPSVSTGGGVTVTHSGLLAGSTGPNLIGTAICYRKTGTDTWEAVATTDPTYVDNAIAAASGGKAGITTTSAGINSTETNVISLTIPANVLTAGRVYRIKASGTCTSTAANACNFRVRIGTAGTSADAILAVVNTTASVSGVNVPFKFESTNCIRTIGVSGTGLGNAHLINNGTTGVSTSSNVVALTTTAITVNSTVQNILHFSFQAAATTTTCTFYLAEIELVDP